MRTWPRWCEGSSIGEVVRSGQPAGSNLDDSYPGQVQHTGESDCHLPRQLLQTSGGRTRYIGIMQPVGLLLVMLIALEHLWFLVLEMFLFVTPTGLATFHMSQEMANTCAVLAKNQGLYNGFLAAALVLAVLTRSALMRRYGLGCVVIAGLYGSWSLGSKDTALFQGLPAAIALVLTELAGRTRASGA